MSDETQAEYLSRISEGIAKQNAQFEHESQALVDKVAEEKGFFGFVLAQITQFFQIAFQHVWSGFYAVFSFAIDPWVNLFTGRGLVMEESAIDKSLAAFQRMGLFDANDVAQMKRLMMDNQIVGSFLSPFVGLLVLFQGVGAFMSVLGGTAIQRMNKKYSPTVPAPESIARTSFIAPEIHDRVVDAMKRSGLSQEDIELVFVSMYTLESPNEIQQLFWRGEITKDQAINRMSEAGYTPTRTAELMQLWERIPGLADIVRYLGKEAFEPEMIQKFGLLEDYPRGEAEKWAAKQGLAPEWAEKEWIAHWRDIGIAPVLEGLHRRTVLNNGQKVDAGFVNDYMRLIEIPGPVRDLIEKTSYNPYTRVDARRMHDMGVLGDDELIGVYMDQGYDLEHATNMALFTIRYNSREGKTFTQSDVEKAYEDGDLTFDQSGELLVQAGFTADYAAFILRRVDTEKARASRLDATEIIKARYLSHLVNEPETRTRLLGVGFGNARASELLDKWNAQRISNAKLPSKTDLDKMLKHQIINEDAYQSEMTKLGYAKGYIEWYLKLARFGTE